jgi:hypothetical protein
MTFFMAKCNVCNKDMSDKATKSCTPFLIPMKKGKPMRPVPWSGPGRCHDCNVAPGGFHHPGCDTERCPKCSGQIITCECVKEAC